MVKADKNMLRLRDGGGTMLLVRHPLLVRKCATVERQPEGLKQPIVRARDLNELVAQVVARSLDIHGVEVLQEPMGFSA